ncbi:MAG: ATP-binding protein [Gemmatimonadota bacterium]
MADPRWDYLNRFSLAYALHARMAMVRTRSELAEILLPELESELEAEVALLILVDRSTGRPTVFGGTDELRRELGGTLRSLSVPELREVLESGPEVPGQPHSSAVPVRVGIQERGVLLVAGARPFGDPDRIALEAIAAFLGVMLYQLTLLEELDQSYREIRKFRDGGTRRQRLEALEQLSAGLGLELERSLLPIRAYSELLAATPSDLSATDREDIERMREAVSAAASILDRMKRGVERARDRAEEPAPIRVAPVVEDVVERNRHRWQHGSDEPTRLVRVETEEGLPRVWCRVEELRDALDQLLLNALAATRGGGEILVRAREAPEDDPSVSRPPGVVVEVVDTGTGMSPSILAQCRDPFFSTRAHPGAGMGLTLVQSVARRYGGRLVLDSVPGEGTRASILLPGWSSKEPEIGPTALRVLCVDADANSREWAEELLRFQGHDVQATAGVREGVGLFLSAIEDDRPFDVAVLGATSPSDPGIGVVQALRAADPRIAVILVGGWSQPGDAPPEGVVGVLGRPLARGELERLLRQIAQERGEGDPRTGG